MFLEKETFISSSMQPGVDSELYITTTEANTLIEFLDPDNNRNYLVNALEIESGSASDIVFKVNGGKYTGIVSPNTIKQLSGKIESITIVTSGAKLRYNGWAVGYTKE